MEYLQKSIASQYSISFSLGKRKRGENSKVVQRFFAIFDLIQNAIFSVMIRWTLLQIFKPH